MKLYKVFTKNGKVEVEGDQYYDKRTEGTLLIYKEKELVAVFFREVINYIMIENIKE